MRNKLLNGILVILVVILVCSVSYTEADAKVVPGGTISATPAGEATWVDYYRAAVPYPGYIYTGKILLACGNRNYVLDPQQIVFARGATLSVNIRAGNYELYENLIGLNLTNTQFHHNPYS